MISPHLATSRPASPNHAGSRPQAFADALPVFEQTHDAEHCYCAQLVTGQLLSLLGYDITTIPHPWASHTWVEDEHVNPRVWRQGPPCIEGDAPRWEAMARRKFTFFYKVPPRRMLALHHRVTIGANRAHAPRAARHAHPLHATHRATRHAPRAPRRTPRAARGTLCLAAHPTPQRPPRRSHPPRRRHLRQALHEKFDRMTVT